MILHKKVICAKKIVSTLILYSSFDYEVTIIIPISNLGFKSVAVCDMFGKNNYIIITKVKFRAFNSLTSSR